MTDFTDADLERESLDNADPELCPCCGKVLDLGWPVKVERPGFDPEKLWNLCRGCGVFVEAV